MSRKTISHDHVLNSQHCIYVLSRQLEELEVPSLDVNQNWTTQERVFPVSLQSSHLDSKLLKSPETLKRLVQQYKQKGQILNTNKNKTKSKFFNNIAMDIFLFIAAIISMLAIIAIIHIVCKHTKLKALLTRIAFQQIKQTEAAATNQIQQHCTVQWHAIAALPLMIELLIIYICLTTQRCTIFKKRLYSNTVNVMLSFSDIKHYITLKLCKTAGSIHLFQIYGQLNSD